MRIHVPKPESLINYLRIQTQDVHQELETTSFMSTLLKNDLTIEGYKKVLLQLNCVLSPIENAILKSPHLDSFASIRSRDYFLSLQDDLDHFGLYSCLQENLEPELSTVAKIAGTLYVIEGSALGGCVLEKLIHKKLNLTKTNGMAYFSTQSELSIQRWKNLKMEIEQSVPKADFEECLQAAINVFRLFS